VEWISGKFTCDVHPTATRVATKIRQCWPSVATVAIIMTPWGKQSGGHFNPAITFAFYRLGKVKLWDAVFYATAQFSGAASGVAIAAAVLHNVPQNEAVRYAVTAPGVFGNLSAFVAELMISFTLMSTILFISNHRSLAQFTPYFVGALYATYITKPAPKVHSVQSANVSQAITIHRPGSWPGSEGRRCTTDRIRIPAVRTELFRQRCP
jgi:Major intrinsic protein